MLLGNPESRNQIAALDDTASVAICLEIVERYVRVGGVAVEGIDRRP
jgi:hypothetical protein